MNNLQLVKSTNFGNVKCDFWQDEHGEVWMTREQIGRALEYNDPQKAIDNLHSRNKNRLDKYSVTLKLRATDGKAYDTTLYNSKGIYEICRWSRQPKADDFIDWVWDVIETLRKTGGYVMEGQEEKFIDIYFPTLSEETKIAMVKDLQRSVKAMKPKADYFDALVERNLLTNFRDTAKELHIKERKFIDWLQDNGYIYRDKKGKIKPYAEYVPDLFELKEFVRNGYTDTQVLITPKGRETFRLLLRKEAIA